MDRRTCRAQFSAKGIVIAILAMVRFSVRVRGRAHMLKIRFCQWRFIGWQSMPTCPAATEDNNGDKRRKDGPGKVTTVSVGQGEPLTNLLTVIHKPIKAFLRESFALAIAVCPAGAAVRAGKDN